MVPPSLEKRARGAGGGIEGGLALLMLLSSRPAPALGPVSMKNTYSYIHFMHYNVHMYAKKMHSYANTPPDLHPLLKLFLLELHSVTPGSILSNKDD